MIIRSTDGKIIGDMDKGVFTKKVDGKVHMLRGPLAWAMDSEAYKRDIRPWCHTIIVEDSQSKLVYSISLETFDSNKVYMDRGYGGQYFVILKHWQVKSQGQVSLFSR